jgi:hypothetical protein
VSHAIGLYEDDARDGDPFDKVFCVFDRDSHTTFDAACKTIAAQKRPGTTFHAITSTPCFEFWLLLHFGYTDKPFQKTSNKSIGDTVVDKLKTKKGFKAYDKGQQDVYKRLKDRLPTAVQAAQQLRQVAKKTGQTNPTTNVDELVLALQALASLD